MEPLHPRLIEQAERLVAKYPESLVSITDVHSVYHFVSPAHTRILGYQPDELIGSHFAKIVVSTDQAHALIGMMDTELNERSVVIGLTLRAKSGKVVHVRGSGRRITDPDTREIFILGKGDVV